MWIPLGSQLLSCNSNWPLKLFPQDWLCKGHCSLHLSSLIKDTTLDKPWTTSNWKLTVSLAKSLLTWVLLPNNWPQMGHVRSAEWILRSHASETEPVEIDWKTSWCRWCLNIHNLLQLSAQHLKHHRCPHYSYWLGHEIAGEIAGGRRDGFQRTCHPARGAILFSASAS